MKKIIYFTTLFFIFSLNLLDAQISDFKLSDYKLADYKRQGISLNFRLNGGQSNSKIGKEIYYSNAFFDNALSGGYFFHKNNRHYSSHIQVDFDGDAQFLKSQIETLSNSKVTNLLGELNISSSQRFFNAEQYFIGFGFFGALSRSKSISKRKFFQSGNWVDTTGNLINKIDNFQANPSMSIGKGRIEPIEDARQALYILEELQKSNRLKRDLTNDEILEFSKLITQLKNERVLDSRLHKIRELTQIDSFLVQSGFVEANDIEYYTRLNDMWDFGGLPTRNSGFQISLIYQPTFSYYKSEVPMQADILNKDFRQGYAFELRWEKPINHKFQSSLSLLGEFYSSSQNNAKTRNLYPHLNYSFGIYPNTRTNLVFSVRLYYNQTWHNVDTRQNSQWTFEEINMTCIPYFNLYYYISPNLRLSAAYNANMNWRNTITIDGRKALFIQNSLNFSMLYSIF